MKKNYLLSAIVLLLLGTGYMQAQWIEPAQYQQMLGRGMDVDWWTTNQDYSQQDWGNTMEDFNNAGIQHVRITLTQDYLSPEDFDLLDEQVNECLNYGITPIIAYKPAYNRGYGSSYEGRISNWWRIMAEHYRNYPARLSFDILLEPNNSMFASYSDLNDFYEDCVSSIRMSNPYRIIFIAPTYNSDPLYLQYLRIPSRANGYLMAEWHFLSEPNYDRSWYNWQNRRYYEQRWINRRIDAALAWQRRTGIYTWVGGWVPGSYFNSGYSSMQDAFTSFLCDALVRASIPFAVRGISHYYDYGNRGWHQRAYRPMQTIFPQGNFAHSGALVDGPNNGFDIGGRRFGGYNNSRGNFANGYRQGGYNNNQQADRNNGFNIGNNQNYQNRNGRDNYGNNNYSNNNYGNRNNGQIRTGGNGRSNEQNVNNNNYNNGNNSVNNPAGTYNSPGNRSNNRTTYNNTGNYTPSRQNGGGFSRSGVQQNSPVQQQTPTQQAPTSRQQTVPSRSQGGNSNSRQQVPATRNSGSTNTPQSAPRSNASPQKSTQKQSAPAQQQQRSGGGGFSRSNNTQHI
jgi:hypothetical protein